MGNSLCRERIARADNSKNPIDRIIGRCAQICPANEAKSNYWQKHVLETGTPTRAQPHSANDGWRKVTLTVPNGKCSNDEPPVAPPRRKRSSVVDRQPCGFKELFGNNVSRRSSCDSILDHPLTEREQEMLQQKRKSKSISDFNMNDSKATTDSLSISTIRIPVTRTLSLMDRSMAQQSMIPMPRPTLQRKVSRVGNKKSDKFFGENLSDCLSDDPITPDPEPTSISFTYHTISTLITPIPHTSHDTNDSLDDVLDAITAASGAVNKKNDDTPAIPKPFTISDSVESKAHAIDNKKSSLDKKAEFLMAMLEGNNSYMQPEEMRTVSPPKRSHSKRKTTETDQPNNHQSIGAEKKTHTKHNVKGVLHHNESNGTSATLYVPVHEPRKHSVKRLEAKPTDHKTTSLKENKENEPAAPARADKSILQQITNSPEKPKRDLNAYESKGKMNNLLSPDTAEENNKPLPRVRHLSQENLMSNKILTAKSNDTIDLMRIKSMQKINDTDTDNLDDNRFEKILKKYTSQQSFFTKDLLSQIADRVYGFEDPFDTTGACDDGSSKCTPNSKLTTRKISVHRKESAITPPILENDHEVVCVKSGPKKIEANSVSSSETLANRRPSNIAENGHDGLHKNGEVARETKHFLSIERDHSIVRERIEPKTIEQTAASPEEVKHEIHETKPIDLSVAFDSGIDDILNVSTISDQLDDIAEPSKTCDKSENANSSDEENTDSDITVKEIPQIELTETISDDEIQDVEMQETFARLYGGRKRGSIVDHDSWFLKHNDLSNLPRRGSESFVGYDTRKVFPFGKSDSGAGSQFFDSKSLSKSAQNINDNNTKDNTEQQTDQNGNSKTHLPSEHSILLKYLK